MNSNKILGEPIIVNLDGSFLAPTATGEYVAGQITPDLRMPHLDAFLSQLNSDMLGEGKQLGDMIAATVSDMQSKMRQYHKDVSVQLSIKCVIDPQTHAMEYTFDISAKAK